MIYFIVGCYCCMYILRMAFIFIEIKLELEKKISELEKELSSIRCESKKIQDRVCTLENEKRSLTQQVCAG